MLKQDLVTCVLRKRWRLERERVKEGMQVKWSGFCKLLQWGYEKQREEGNRVGAVENDVEKNVRKMLTVIFKARGKTWGKGIIIKKKNQRKRTLQVP